jgi:hypothetical protein
MNQLERVARAICGYKHDRSQIYWPSYTREAQVAIDAMQEWQPIETVPLETLVFVWGKGFEDVVLTRAFLSHEDGVRTLFQGLSDAQRPSHWHSKPEPPK